MKKLSFISLCFFCAFSANALTFICGEPKRDVFDVVDAVYSKLQWTTDAYASYGQAKMSPTPPRAGDDIVIRNRYRVRVDTDVKASTFKLETINEVRFDKGKKLETRKNLSIRLVLMGDSFIEFNSGKAVIGGSLDLESRDQVDELGTAGVRLIDSEMNIGGSLTTALKAGNFASAPQRGGVRIFMKGKSSMNVAGIVLPDPQYKEFSERISFEFQFEESGGSIPVFAMGEGSLDACKFSLKISKAKKGVYPLALAAGRKSSAEMLSYTVNRKSVKLGERFDIGETQGLLKLAAADKDGRNENDLVLEIF